MVILPNCGGEESTERLFCHIYCSGVYFIFRCIYYLEPDVKLRVKTREISTRHPKYLRFRSWYSDVHNFRTTLKLCWTKPSIMNKLLHEKTTKKTAPLWFTCTLKSPKYYRSPYGTLTIPKIISYSSLAMSLKLGNFHSFRLPLFSNTFCDC